MLNLVLDMRLFILLIAYLSCQQLVGQCVMQITDTTHVNCFGESSGSFLLDIVAESPYTITLSTGEASVNGSGFSNLIAGNYEIVLVDNQQCVDTLQIKIKEPAQLVADIRCEGAILKASIQGGVLDYSILWRNEMAELISDDLEVAFQPKGFYDFEVVDSKGCSVSDTIFVSADFSVAVSIGELPFDVFITNNSSSSYEFNWDFGDGNSSTSVSPFHTYDAVGSYSLQLQVQDEHECIDQRSVNIDVQGFEMSSNDWQEMANAFSPNGDGVNDRFSFWKIMQ